MLTIGCHLSTSNGLAAMGETALSIGANTFAYFTRNPRGGSVRALDPDDLAGLARIVSQNRFGTLVAHAPYTYNLCSATPSTREFAIRCMGEDLDRLESFPPSYYNFHPGSHVKQGVDVGIDLIVAGLDQVLEHGTTTVLLETMAGKGSEVGGTFEELRRIIDGVGHPERLGVCLDTCHVSDAGYDIEGHLDDVLDEFDRVVGMGRLKALHLNDSKNPRGAHKDRHERIGEGHLGLETFRAVVRNPRLRDLPMILETPNELPGYAEEISLLRGMSDEDGE